MNIADFMKSKIQSEVDQNEEVMDTGPDQDGRYAKAYFDPEYKRLSGSKQFLLEECSFLNEKCFLVCQWDELDFPIDVEVIVRKYNAVTKELIFEIGIPIKFEHDTSFLGFDSDTVDEMKNNNYDYVQFRSEIKQFCEKYEDKKYW